MGIITGVWGEILDKKEVTDGGCMVVIGGPGEEVVSREVSRIVEVWDCVEKDVEDVDVAILGGMDGGVVPLGIFKGGVSTSAQQGAHGMGMACDAGPVQGSLIQLRGGGGAGVSAARWNVGEESLQEGGMVGHGGPMQGSVSVGVML